MKFPLAQWWHRRTLVYLQQAKENQPLSGIFQLKKKIIYNTMSEH